MDQNAQELQTHPNSWRLSGEDMGGKWTDRAVWIQVFWESHTFLIL